MALGTIISVKGVESGGLGIVIMFDVCCAPFINQDNNIISIRSLLDMALEGERV